MKVVQRPCPICSGPGRTDKPDLRVLDATCTVCGWHYTTRKAVKPDRGTVVSMNFGGIP